MSITGEDGGLPTRVGASIGDITAGLFLVAGVNAALYHRELTGEGMLLDVGMLDCQVAILENAIARYTALGEVPGPIGARHPSITPFAALRTATAKSSSRPATTSCSRSCARYSGNRSSPQIRCSSRTP